jgi:hypothetical protein
VECKGTVCLELPECKLKKKQSTCKYLVIAMCRNVTVAFTCAILALSRFNESDCVLLYIRGHKRKMFLAYGFLLFSSFCSQWDRYLTVCSLLKCMLILYHVMN